MRAARAVDLSQNVQQCNCIQANRSTKRYFSYIEKIRTYSILPRNYKHSKLVILISDSEKKAKIKKLAVVIKKRRKRLRDSLNIVPLLLKRENPEHLKMKWSHLIRPFAIWVSFAKWFWIFNLFQLKIEILWRKHRSRQRMSFLIFDIKKILRRKHRSRRQRLAFWFLKWIFFDVSIRRSRQRRIFFLFWNVWMRKKLYKADCATWETKLITCNGVIDFKI